MTTILEILHDVDYNLQHYHRSSCSDIAGVNIRIAKTRLHNAAILLKKGYSLDDDIDSILEGHDYVEGVPDYDDREEE